MLSVVLYQYLRIYCKVKAWTAPTCLVSKLEEESTSIWQRSWLHVSFRSVFIFRFFFQDFRNCAHIAVTVNCRDLSFPSNCFPQLNICCFMYFFLQFMLWKKILLLCWSIDEMESRPKLLRARSFGIFRNKNIFRIIFRLFCSWEQNSRNGNPGIPEWE